MSQHHIVKDLATLHADKAVVELGLAVWLQRLHIAQFCILAVEGRARDGALCGLRGGGGGLSLHGGLRGDIALGGGGLVLGGGGAPVVGRKGGEARRSRKCSPSSGQALERPGGRLRLHHGCEWRGGSRRTPGGAVWCSLYERGRNKVED